MIGDQAAVAGAVGIGWLDPAATQPDGAAVERDATAADEPGPDAPAWPPPVWLPPGELSTVATGGGTSRYCRRCTLGGAATGAGTVVDGALVGIRPGCWLSRLRCNGNGAATVGDAETSRTLAGGSAP